MATSGQGIWRPIGSDPNSNGYVRDYRHAARIFRSNDYARAPKSKFLFYVSFVINAAAENEHGTYDFPLEDNELNYLVKSVELPKFDIEVDEINQYNRKSLVQKQIKYSPVTIKFHDDNTGSLRQFWHSYYTFYYGDGRYSDEFKVDDKYANLSTNRWGFDTGIKKHLLDSIEIYSFYHSQAQLIVLENPIISAFGHDSHDYSEGQGLMESTMTVRYTGVTYINDPKIDAMFGVNGFGQAAPEGYDTDYSPLTKGDGSQIDPVSGELYYPDQMSESTSVGSERLINPAVQNAAFNTNPSTPVFVTNSQLATLSASLSQKTQNTNFIFPTASDIVVATDNSGSIHNQNIDGSMISSNGEAVYSPEQINVLYQAGSWQQNLYMKGYTDQQINAATTFIAQANYGTDVNVQLAAEQFINSKSNNYNYGQASTTPTSINFNDPLSTTQAIYGGSSWQQTLSSKGYTQADISRFNNFLSKVKISATADIASIAESYINNNKR